MFHLSSQAEGVRQVRWPNEEHVDAIHSRDGLYPFHSPLSLNMKDDECLQIGLLNVFTQWDNLPIVRCTNARQPANASRVIFEGLDRSFDFLGRIHPGYMGTLRASVEVSKDDRGLIGRHPYKGCDLPELSGAHHMLTIAWLQGPMLPVEDKKIPALMAHHIDQTGIGEANEATKYRLACFQLCLGQILLHAAHPLNWIPGGEIRRGCAEMDRLVSRGRQAEQKLPDSLRPAQTVASQ